MRRVALWGTGLVYAVSWFLPVIKDGPTLSDGRLPGWEALTVALTPLWDEINGTFLQGALSVLSGLTNLLFLAGAARLALRPALPGKRLSWALFGAAGLNTFWIIDMGEPGEMRAGYWLWLASFALLGLVARLSPAVPPAAA